MLKPKPMNETFHNPSMLLQMNAGKYLEKFSFADLFSDRSQSS
jgi:hypothetical protein